MATETAEPNLDKFPNEKEDTSSSSSATSSLDGKEYELKSGEGGTSSVGELVVAAPNVKLGSGRGPGIWVTYRRDVNNEVSGSEARTA